MFLPVTSLIGVLRTYYQAGTPRLFILFLRGYGMILQNWKRPHPRTWQTERSEQT